jgi:hypothetical protein
MHHHPDDGTTDADPAGIGINFFYPIFNLILEEKQ